MVAPEQITASVNLSDGTTIPVELSPQHIFGEGRAWSYYATITPQQGGQHGLNASLRVNYLGREYIHFAQPLLFSVPLPLLAPIEGMPGGFPSWAVALIVLIAPLLLWGLFWLLRTRPYGLLYDDQGATLVDFRQVRRDPLRNLLFKSSIWGRETRIPNLEGIVFHFNRGRVHLSYSSRSTSTIRVNNQPVTGRTALEDRFWIGAQGKLYMFLSHTAEQSAFAERDQRSVTETPEG